MSSACVCLACGCKHSLFMFRTKSTFKIFQTLFKVNKNISKDSNPTGFTNEPWKTHHFSMMLHFETKANPTSSSASPPPSPPPCPNGAFRISTESRVAHQDLLLVAIWDVSWWTPGGWLRKSKRKRKKERSPRKTGCWSTIPFLSKQLIDLFDLESSFKVSAWKNITPQAQPRTNTPWPWIINILCPLTITGYHGHFCSCFLLFLRHLFWRRKNTRNHNMVLLSPWVSLFKAQSQTSFSKAPHPTDHTSLCDSRPRGLESTNCQSAEVGSNLTAGSKGERSGTV